MSITPHRTNQGRILLIVSLALLLAFAVVVLVMAKRKRPSAPAPPLHNETMLLLPDSQDSVSFRTAR